MHLRFGRWMAVGWALILLGCPDPDPPAETTDAVAGDATTLDGTVIDDRGPPPDAGPADAGPPDAEPPDGAPPPDAEPSPDAAPPPAVESTAELCVGCGHARSDDYSVVQRVVPFSTRKAASADFSMELLSAPKPSEAAR